MDSHDFDPLKTKKNETKEREKERTNDTLIWVN